MTDDLGRGAYDVVVDNAEALAKVAQTEDAFAKAGDAGGRSGLIAKGAMTAFAGAAGLATKGMLELENVQAKYTADTGATAEEARAAGKAINEMSGRNLQPMAAIGAALAKVHTDLGLTGKAAEDTTQNFLHFARATGQDASAAVSSFDDILDAWGLTADQSRGIMDKLIVSHQKYGGSIEANQASLAAMAPQLRALNLDIDDGIALLNLFASSGLDAAAIPKALNAAIQNLDGRPLEDFVAELAGIEDPGERARRAVEVFGAKAGVQLANAIKPGMTSLEAFQVTATEAAGATEKARDAIDGTFGNRVQLLIKEATSKLVEFGGAFGPVVTGAASLASLGGALGLDKFVAPFVKRLLEAGKQGGEALIDGIGTATGAAGTIIGNFFASRIEVIMDPTKNSLLGGIIRGAASKAATIYLTALILADRISLALSNAWTSVAGTGSAATKAAGLAGKAAGAAYGLGVVAVVATIAQSIKAPLDNVAKQIHDSLGVLPDIDLNPSEWQWPLGSKGEPNWLGLGQEAEEGAGSISGRVQGVLAHGASAVGAGAKTGLTDPIIRAQDRAQKEAAAIARATPFEVAKSLREGADPVKMAAELLKDAIANAISPAKEIAALEGELTGRDLARKLNSKKPEVRAAAQAYKLAIEERLFALRNGVPDIAADTGTTYGDALKAKQTSVGQKAAAMVGAASKQMALLEGKADNYGARTGTAYAQGLAGSLAHDQYLVRNALAGYQRLLMAASPPGPDSPLHKIDVWGTRTGDAWIGPLVSSIARGPALIRSRVGEIASVLGGVGFGAVAPLTGGLAGAGAGPSGSQGGVQIGDIYVNMNVERLVASDAQAVQGLGRALGNEVRLSMMRSPATFATTTRG